MSSRSRAATHPGSVRWSGKRDERLLFDIERVVDGLVARTVHQVFGPEPETLLGRLEASNAGLLVPAEQYRRWIRHPRSSRIVNGIRSPGNGTSGVGGTRPRRAERLAVSPRPIGT